MANFTKQSKVMLILGSVALIAAITLAAMYATGVIPSQSKGEAYKSICVNDECLCHTHQKSCMGVEYEECACCDECSQ